MAARGLGKGLDSLIPNALGITLRMIMILLLLIVLLL